MHDIGNDWARAARGSKGRARLAAEPDNKARRETCDPVCVVSVCMVSPEVSENDNDFSWLRRCAAVHSHSTRLNRLGRKPGSFPPMTIDDRLQ
jgi:hypothetical protein